MDGAGDGTYDGNVLPAKVNHLAALVGAAGKEPNAQGRELPEVEGLNRCNIQKTVANGSLRSDFSAVAPLVSVANSDKHGRELVGIAVHCNLVSKRLIMLPNAPGLGNVGLEATLSGLGKGQGNIGIKTNAGSTEEGMPVNAAAVCFLTDKDDNQYYKYFLKEFSSDLVGVRFN